MTSTVLSFLHACTSCSLLHWDYSNGSSLTKHEKYFFGRWMSDNRLRWCITAPVTLPVSSCRAAHTPSILQSPGCAKPPPAPAPQRPRPERRRCAWRRPVAADRWPSGIPPSGAPSVRLCHPAPRAATAGTTAILVLLPYYNFLVGFVWFP